MRLHLVWVLIAVKVENAQGPLLAGSFSFDSFVDPVDQPGEESAVKRLDQTISGNGSLGRVEVRHQEVGFGLDRPAGQSTGERTELALQKLANVVQL